MKKILILIALLLSGCATTLNGSTQYLSVIPFNNDQSSDTKCVAKNEEGKWTTVNSQPITIHRDGNPMQVSCENKNQSGSIDVDPKFKAGYIFANLLIDVCTISCIVDGSNNSWYVYPETIAVPMSNK